jgi:hypothetical protein
MSVAAARKELTGRLHAELPPRPTLDQVAHTEQSLGLATLRAHPVGYALEVAQGGGRLVFGPGDAEFATATGGHATAVMDAYGVVYLVGLYGLAAVGMWSAWRSRTLRNAVLPILVIAYMILVSSGLEAYSRFRVPIMPYFALLAGVGVTAVGRGGYHGVRHRPSELQTLEDPVNKAEGNQP